MTKAIERQRQIQIQRQRDALFMTKAMEGERHC